MQVSTLRQLWFLIETTQADTLLQLNNGDLVERLLAQIKTRTFLSCEENMLLTNYIHAKTPLIRDLAEARLA